MSELPMSGGEFVLTLLSTIFALVMWVRWYLQPAQLERLGAPGGGWPLLSLTPLFCLAVLFAVLRTLASHDVRDDVRYLAMYTMVGAAWLAAWMTVMPILGLNVRDDVHERGNRAAAYAAAGALLGITLTFAGGNVGDGPGWWVVVFSAGMATVALYLLWALLEHFAHVSEHVTVERDAAAGVRLAGYLAACGLVLGRAAAGDWVSANAALVDFVRVALPTVGLLVIAILVERRARTTPQHPERPMARWGLVPAALYVGIAAAYLIGAGIPE